MNNTKIVTLLTGGLIVLSTLAAEVPDRPLHVLYLGPVSVGGGGRGGGFGGSRTNYVYLPGQTLAPDAIYFDHLTSAVNLTGAYLKHFDAVVQVIPDAEVGAPREKLLNEFKGAGNALLKYTERPTDSMLRDAVLGAVSKQAKLEVTAQVVFVP